MAPYINDKIWNLLFSVILPTKKSVDTKLDCDGVVGCICGPTKNGIRK